MRTLNLSEAADFLHIHPITLLRKAQSGEVPAAKPGKRWVFLDIDLAEYLRAHYQRQASNDSNEIKEHKLWLSIDKKSQTAGGLTSPSADDEYAKALGLTTKGKQRSITTV